MDDRQPERSADFSPGGAPGPSPGSGDFVDDPRQPPPLPPSHHDEARRYHRTGRRVGIARTALGFLFLAGLLFSGASIALADWTRVLTDNPWLGMALFCAVLMIGFEVLTLPLDYLGGHRLARRFGLSRQNAAGWLWDRLKGAGIGFAIGLLASEAWYGLLRGTGPLTFPLWAGAAFLGFLILAGWLAPVLLMPVFFKTRRVEDAGLENRLAELARGSGANVRGVYQFDLGRKSRTATAALTGLGKTRRILLSDTLLEGFSHEEISVVLAHELAHHGRRHIPKLIAAQAVLGTVVFYGVVFALRAWGPGLGVDGAADPAGLPLALLVLGGAGLLAAPFGNSVSRAMERRCDDDALRATKDPESFISAMRKLSRLNLAEESPPAWVERMFYSHPSISRRIAHAEEFAGNRA